MDTRLLSPDYLFQTPPGDPTTGFGVLTALFVVLLVASAALYFRRGRLAPDNPAMRRMFRRIAKAGMWCAAIGLFLALMRYAQVPYFSMPILLYLFLLGVICVVGYFVYEFSERYPIAVWRLQESHVQRQYRPAARPVREPQRVRPKVRGKRRR